LVDLGGDGHLGPVERLPAAQQLSTLASLPSVIVIALVSFNVIHATLGLAFGLGALLLVLDRLGWRVVSALFDRERLITGTRS
jgi:hypothetical protein